MGRLVLVTGGSRSGKSGYAQHRAEETPGSRLFVATCPVMDAEMAQRVRRHREAREGKGWITLEEPVDLEGALDRAQDRQIVLVDCLTLWVNNLMYHAEQAHRDLDEPQMADRAAALAAVCKRHPGTVLLVTNEVGWGIIPENALARRFRDLAGRCNQVIASAADEVVLVVCGIPTFLKK